MINRTKHGLLSKTLLFVTALFCLPVSAYHLFYINSGAISLPVAWRISSVAFTADTDGPASQNFTTLSQTATQTWNGVTDALDIFGTVTTSTVNFTGANYGTAWGVWGDGKYELVYDADGSALSTLGYDPASTNGLGPSRKQLVGGVATIDDAFFVVTGTRTNFDLLSTMIHELGHILGLAHSTVGMHTSSTPDTALDKITLSSVPTMHPFSLPSGNTGRRTLEADDMAAMRELYPASGAGANWAGVSGVVTRCGTNVPVTGASVRLVNTSNSNIQISRFTGYDGNTDGRYVASYLPAGSYRVIVEPMGANGFTLNRFGSPPSKAESDFDFEYLSDSTDETACTEAIPEAAGPGIRTLTASNGLTLISNDIRVGSPDLAFVIDDTGSMGQEIAAVRNILNAAITTLQAASVATPFPLTSIVTFKDDVTKRIVSNDPAKLRTVVNGLSASGGGDCQEAGNAALLVAGRMLKPKGVAVLFTDADSRADGPGKAEVTSYYRSKGARLFTLLSGTCTGNITTSDAPSGPEPAEELPDGAEGFTAPVPRQSASAHSGQGNSVNEEYPAQPVLGAEPAVTTFSDISTATGGFYVAIPGINESSATETTRYTNVGTNLAISAVLPAVALINPSYAPQGSALTVDVFGSNTNFVAGQSTVSFSGTGITVSNVTVVSPTRLQVELSGDSTATLGFRDISVSTDLGGSTPEAARGLGSLDIVTAPTTPQTISVTPSQGSRGQTLDLTINVAGGSFGSTSVAQLGSGVTVQSCSLVNPTKLVCRVLLSSTATVGYRRVSVTTTGAATIVDRTPAGAFLVTSSAPLIPLIQTVSPSSVLAGSTATLTIVGSNTSFAAGSTSLGFSQGDIVTNSVTVNSPTELTASITVAPSAVLNFRDVTATTGGEIATILAGLRITSTAPPPPPPPPPPPSATLTVTPANLVFSAAPNAAKPSAQVSVATVPVGTALVISLTKGASYFTLKNVPATAPGAFTVEARTDLPAGTFEGEVTVTAGSLESKIPIVLTISEGESQSNQLRTPETLVTSKWSPGDTNPVFRIPVTATGNDVSFQAILLGAPAWISVASGSNGATPTDVRLVTTPGSLAPGFYEALLVLTSSNASSALVRIRLEVTAPVSFITLEKSLKFTLPKGGAPVDKIFYVTGAGRQIEYTVESSAGWLKIANPAGMTPVNLKLTIDPIGVQVGSYKATLTLIDTGAKVAPVQIPVELEVVEPPSDSSVTAGLVKRQ